ncbi:biotin--[acetyl-CoA-carboxylase] ligase [Winogradskyella sp. A3E31]|uniref:biotin--[acetyl-CoA-carboxylase] ligase n=1 Tax=Winogradskyella sp. A3E31 TaxID=3349637 RepID=UPI00398A5A9E
MPIIKLNAIDSTNAYIKRKALMRELEDFTTVVAKLQTEGRGQMGTRWQSEGSKNLMCSIYKRISGVENNRQYYISMITALAVTDALKTLNIPKISIKWPNDILSEGHKIGGILIENLIKHNKIHATIIGIGLNVNQKFFYKLPKASSLYVLTGQLFDTDELMTLILKHLKEQFRLLENHDFKLIKSNYEALLFRKQKPSTFETSYGKHFTGYINGVTEDGKLEVMVEDGILKTFDLKEVSLKY